MRNLLAVAVALMAPLALAERIAVLPFTGPGSNASRNQLVTALCASADCVAANRVTKGAGPDWKKMRRELVAVVVAGRVTRKGRTSMLELTITDGANGSPSKNRLQLGADGTMSARTLAVAVEAVRQRMAPALTPPVEAAPPPPPAREPPPPPPPVKAAPPPTASVEPAPRPAEEPPPPVKRKKAKRAPFLALELGADLFNRRLDYVQPVSAALRRYELGFVAMPTLKAELYPLALTGDDGLLGGLGLEVGVAAAPWLRSRRPNSQETFATALWRIDAGLRLRITPVKGFSFWPAVGLWMHSFTVSPLADGTRIEGLPNLSYTGLRAGLAFEVKLLDDLLALFGRFDVIPVFSSGEIISSAFFQGGSTFGLDASAGVGFQLLPVLQLRASAELTRYSLTFRTQPTDAYVAQGAVDQYLGGNVAARFSF